MLKLISAFACLFLATAALAQDAREDRVAAAERYVKSEGQQRMLDQMLSPQVLAAQLAAQFPQIPISKRDELAAIASEEISKIRPSMEAAIVEAAVEVLTAPEIAALDAFYRTPEGASVLTKMQPFMQSAFRAMGPAMREAQGAIARRAQTLVGQ